MQTRAVWGALIAGLVLQGLLLPSAAAGELPGRGAAPPRLGRTLDVPTERDLLETRRSDETPRREPSSASPPPPGPSKPTPPPAPIRATVQGSRVVATAGDLARVSLAIEIRNERKHSAEWRRVYPMHPDAEVIGARLEREDEEPIEARTLTLDDARRLYGAVRSPARPTRTRRRGGRDPLRLERPTRDRLTLHVWPLAPKETVRVHLTFVMPLDTQADGAGPATPLKPILQPEAPTLITIHDPRPDEALVVRGGGLGTSVAVWRFDPARILNHGGWDCPADWSLRLVGRQGATHRIAPHVFGARQASRPVTASVRQHADAVRYAVELVDDTGVVRAVLEQTVPARRAPPDSLVAGTVTAWHRAAVARRVLSWAGENPLRLERAMRYAVDLGVLVEGGTSALAVPRDALWRLERADRALYERDGVPLGAQRREADGRSPPAGALGL